MWPPATLPAHWGCRRRGYCPARKDNVPLIYMLLESADGTGSTVRSTGRLAMWWTSSEVVLVLEDAMHQVSLEQRSFRKAAGKPGKDAALLLMGLVR